MKKLVFMSIVILLLVVTGCSKKEDRFQETYNTYKENWMKQNFSAMYDMLDSESKDSITREDFENRYSKIYRDIEASQLVISEKVVNEETKSEDNRKIPFKMKMMTVYGEWEIEDYSITIVKNKDEYQVKWNESLIFPQMVKGDKIGMRTTLGERGTIVDRNNIPLAMNDIVRTIGIAPLKFEADKELKLNQLATILDVSSEMIKKKLDANSNPEHFVPIVNVSTSDIEKIKAATTIEGVTSQSTKSRVYNGGEAIGSLIGYVGAITAEELEKNQGQGYLATSTIGKTGLELVYEEKLRAKHGGEIYIKRGDQEISLLSRQPKNGENIKLAIDLSLQQKVYAEMTGEKGASTALDPKTGEVLALVSSPSYDPNVFVTYRTNTQKKIWEESGNSQVINRFNNAYSPGSTFKLLTAATGLETGVIKPEEAKNILGKQWQKDLSWGSYKVTRVKELSKPVNFKDAIKYSDNIYFAQVALDSGTDTFIEGVSKFGIGEKISFEYPMTQSQISNSGEIKSDIALADSGYGQGEILMTPLDVALSYSALGNNGDIMQPRLMISEGVTPVIWKKAIDPKHVSTLVQSFIAVVNDTDGTGHSAKLSNKVLAGKTGTAEIKGSQEDKDGQENGWFVGLNTENPSIVMSMIIEDVKDRGGSNVATKRVKNVMEAYLK